MENGKGCILKSRNSETKVLNYPGGADVGKECFVGKRKEINLRKYTLVLYCLLVGICPDAKARTLVWGFFNSPYLCVHCIREHKLQTGPDKAHPEVGVLGESAFNFPIYCRGSS